MTEVLVVTVVAHAAGRWEMLPLACRVAALNRCIGEWAERLVVVAAVAGWVDGAVADNRPAGTSICLRSVRVGRLRTPLGDGAIGVGGESTVQAATKTRGHRTLLIERPTVSL